MSTMTDERSSVRLQRTISAPPERVYQAWLEPDLIRRWLAPGGVEVVRVDLDERVGGHYRIWHQHDGADIGGFECEVLELVPAARIVFRWGFVGPDRTSGPVFDSLLTITLSDGPGGTTKLTLVHERLDGLRVAMPEVADAVGRGWSSALDKLAMAAESNE